LFIGCAPIAPQYICSIFDELKLWNWFEVSYEQDNTYNFDGSLDFVHNSIGYALAMLGLSTTSKS
jgi:hypothetical protein